MTPIRRASPQTTQVLAVLAGNGGPWAYGYDIARETGLKSGSLYPILRRLAEQGWLEARWDEASTLGRPARHLYRLTPTGAAAIKEAAVPRRTSSAVRDRRAAGA